MTEITGNNYIYVYKKYSTTTPFVASNYWEEVFEDQPVPPGLHIQLDTHTGRKYAKILEEPRSTNEKVKWNEDGKKTNGEKKVSTEKEKVDTEKHFNKNVMKKEDNSMLKAKNKENAKFIKASNKYKGCKKEYKNLSNHLKRSFSCQHYYKVDDLCRKENSKRS